MNTQTMLISTLTKDPANVRKHGQKNLDAIMGSLKRFGQQKPIVVDGRGIVVAGNGTLEAAIKLGWTEITVVRTELFFMVLSVFVAVWPHQRRRNLRTPLRAFRPHAQIWFPCPSKRQHGSSSFSPWKSLASATLNLASNP